jgi:hypothetical protein
MTSHRTLGVHENPAGICKTEYTHLVTKGQKMAQLISAQSITCSEAWTAYRSIYLPSMRCNLPATSFTRQDLATIQRSPIQVLLSVMGFNRKIPLAVVLGPAYLGGASAYVVYTSDRATSRSQHYSNTSGNTVAEAK